jgi:hypothetical protein
VAIVKVPLTVAVVPDAVFEKLKVADPAPPLIWSSSFSVSSIMISIGILHITQLRMRGPITPASQAKLWAFLPCRQVIQGVHPRRTKDACSCGPAGHPSASKSAATCAAGALDPVPGWSNLLTVRARGALLCTRCAPHRATSRSRPRRVRTAHYGIRLAAFVCVDRALIRRAAALWSNLCVSRARKVRYRCWTNEGSKQPHTEAHKFRSRPNQTFRSGWPRTP